MAEPIELEVHWIRIPEGRIRTETDEAADVSLRESIRVNGVLERLIVTPAAGKYFELVAGFRRLTQARLLGLEKVPCDVVTDRAALRAIELHENIEREDLGTVDEAEWLWKVYQELGEDWQALLATVRKPAGYVERRFALLQGDAGVLAAVRAGGLALGVAEEINKMTRPEDRELHLQAAVSRGATVREVRVWREQANIRAQHMLKPEAVQEIVDGAHEAARAQAAAAPRYYAVAKPEELSSSEEPRNCLLCGDERPEFRMYVRHVCGACADRFLLKLDPKVGLLRGGGGNAGDR